MSDVVRDVIEKPKVEDTNEIRDLLNDSLCNFGLQLLHDIASDGQTVVLSPTAIVLSLGLLYCGTDGETKLQLKRAISSLAVTDEELLKELKQVDISVNTTSKEFVLRISKWLFSSLKYETNQVYKETIAKVFKSKVLPVDFVSNVEQLRQEINSLIKEETNKKIRDVISVGVLTAKTKLLGINAAYFQHFWLDCVITKDHKFHPTKSTTITADMVTIVGDELKYTKNDKCQILGIPYRQSDIVTFFILPNEDIEFNEFCTQLSGKGLIKLLDSAYTSSVHAEIPLFNLQQRFDVTEHLKNKNITEIFTDNGNFSSMLNSDSNPTVSAMIHVASFDYKIVSKDSELRLLSKEPHRFKANRPFMFAVVEQKTMSFVLLGHYFG